MVVAQGVGLGGCLLGVPLTLMRLLAWAGTGAQPTIGCPAWHPPVSDDVFDSSRTTEPLDLASRPPSLQGLEQAHRVAYRSFASCALGGLAAA